MSALADRIAAEHRLVQYSDDVPDRCSCTWMQRTYSHAAHIAEVTEAAVRAQIAADIEAKPRDLVLPLAPVAVGDSDLPTWMHGAIAGVLAAARIAKGGAS